MVVDHDLDEAPTADYDPRNVGSYDPRARGVFSSAQPIIPSAPPAPRFDEHVLRTTQSSALASEVDEEEAPATVQMPTTTGKTPSSRGPIPEARPSEGRRRTSRRTVKIPDDPVRRRELDLLAQTSERAHPAVDSTERQGVAAPSIADLDFSDEITIVKPLRIISVGDEAPPPYSSPHATWPPPGHSMVRLGGTPDAAGALGSAQLAQAPPSNRSPRVEPGGTASTDSGLEAQPSTAARDVEPGWTPAAPPVAEQLARAGAIAGGSSTAEEQARAPIAEHAEAPSITVDADAGASVSSELLEEIELDAHADVEVEVDVAPEPKRAPPPPPKRRPAAEAPKAPEQPRKGRPWWDELFSDEYIRTMDQLEPKVARREVDFIEESLGLERHAIVLDLACGMGEITNELASRGYGVVGLDYSTGMLARAQAAAKARQREDADYRPPSYVQSDMRELAYDEEFDGVYCWSTSFGFFDEETNANLLTRINRALRQGGLLLIDVVNRDYVAPRTPSLVWFEGEGAVCMDDVHVDFFSSRMKMKRTAMFEGGSSRELEYSIRLYTLHELGKLLHEAGFKVLEVTGHPAHRGVFFGAESPRVIVLAEKS
jgi:SAM-dependent methyltransferase